MELSLRYYLDALIKKNRLARIEKEVDPKYEMAAILKKTKGRQPILFEDVKGYKMPVVGGICGNRAHIADLLGANEKKIYMAYIQALGNPLPILNCGHAPCQENKITGNIELDKIFPIITSNEKDAGAFITSGIFISRQPGSGKIHTSVRRLQFQGGNKISVLIESPGLMGNYLKLEEQGKELEFAVLIGVHPAITLASQINSQIYNLDKLEAAGALADAPVEVVKGITVDLPIPVYTEIVLEGRMYPSKRLTEGPYGELLGYYGCGSPQPYGEISAVTHRDNPICHVVCPGTFEHSLPNALMREMSLYLNVRQIVPGVKDVLVTPVAGGRMHAAISIKKKSEGEGKSAVMAAFASNKDYKLVTVVDDDVDIFTPHELEWAVATRVQADKDVVIIPGARGCGLDPSNGIAGTTAKMGIDATYPLENKEIFQKTKIPGIENIDPASYIVNKDSIIYEAFTWNKEGGY